MFLRKLFSFLPRGEFARALRLFNGGHYARALKMFEEIAELPEAARGVDAATLELYMCEAHAALAREHAEAGRAEDAIAAMERAVELKPMFADMHYRLGVYYFDQRRYDAARRSFTHALEINNRFFRARVHLALAHRAAGNDDAALAELERARMACPGFYVETLENLIRSLRSTDGGDPDALFRDLLEERPSSAQISRELAIQAIQNGDDEEAIRELRKAIALKPDYPDLHNYLGIAYGNRGMIDDAVQEFETALKINPYYLKARLNLAILYYENDRYEEAQEQLDQVLAVQPDNQLANNLQNELRAVARPRA